MKYIMLTGHRKSGTTLLHKLFDSHPDINVFPVDLTLLYAYFPCWLSLDSNQKKKRISDVITHATKNIAGLYISRKVNLFNAQQFIEYLWEKVDVDFFNTPSKIVETMANVYCDYADLDKEKPFLFKETSQTIHARAMIDAGLNMKVLQIIRDPRDNYAAIKSGVTSYYSKMGEGENESLASLLNRAGLDLQLARKLSVEKNTWFNAIKFEDLVENPETCLKHVCDFLEVSFSDSLRTPTLLGKHFAGNSHEGKRFSGVSPENVGRWKERISCSEAAIIEGWLETEMEYWNYAASTGLDKRLLALSSFYNWYNCRYFYHDSIYSDAQT